MQLSDKLGKSLPATLKADEDRALDAQYRGRRHEVEQSASRRSSRSGSSCSPLGKEIEVEGSQQKEETGPKQNHGQEGIQQHQKLQKAHDAWKHCDTLQIWEVDPYYDASYSDIQTTHTNYHCRSQRTTSIKHMPLVGSIPTTTKSTSI